MGAIAERLIAAGMSEEQAAGKELLWDRCRTAIGKTRIDAAVFAPGRVEFLGKHTDYCGGRSLLCTVDRGLIVTAVAQNRNTIRITETSSGETVEFAATLDLQPRSEHWSNYPMTVVRRLAQNFGRNLRGADIAIASDLPRAAGLSSSSALVVAMFLTLSQINQLPSHPSYASNIHTLEDLGGYLGCIENGQNFKNLTGDRGVGTFGGSQDHTAILCSKSNTLVQYRFAPVVAERVISFPSDYTLAIGVSGVVAEKTGAARDLYNQVSLRATEILHIWNTATSRRDPTLAAACASSDAAKQIRSLLAGSQLLLERFDQFLEESEKIIPQAAAALEHGDFTPFGRLVDRSQHMADQMLHNQVPETVFLTSEARSLGAIAASAFGAGFGGSVWAMTPIAQSAKFLADWKRAYAAKFPQHADHCEFFTSRPCIPATTLLSPSA